MEEYPMLIPLWQNMTLREEYNSDVKNYLDLFPDHGGAGVDVKVKENVETTMLKSSTPKVSFASKYCSIPFMHPNKVKSLRDPCLDKLKERRRKQQNFEKRLNTMQNRAKRNGKFRDSIVWAAENFSKDCDVNEISVPQSVVELARTMPDEFSAHEANWSFTGGCLTALVDQTCNSETTLFHPFGRKMNQLALTPIIKQSNECKAVIPAVDQQKVIKLSGGRILQIEVETANNSRQCCVRQKKTYHYVNIDENSETAENYFQVESFTMEQEISNIAMSPHVPGEYAVVTIDGLLLIEDIETRNTVWQVENPLQHDPLITDSWWGCDFGAHPFEVLYMDHMKLSLFDLRMRNPLDILSLPNPFILNDERLMVTRRLLDNPIQHLVATDHNLFIFDERYPQQPVMSWNHLLKSVPLYSDVKCYNRTSEYSQYVLLLASQESQEISSFYFQSQSYNKVQPLSLSPPLHLSTFRDCGRSLRLHGIPLDDTLIKRLSMPLIGICSIPHFNQEGFTVLQLSSIGDVFYQCFQQVNDAAEEKTYHVGAGCVLTPPEEILPELNSWFDMARVAEKQEMKSLKYVDSSDVLRKMLQPQKRAKKCCICQGGLLSSNADKIDVQVCPSCGLDVDVSSQLVEKTANISILTGQFSSQSDADGILNLVDFEKLTNGPLSKKILKVWTDDNPSLIQSPEIDRSGIPPHVSFKNYSEMLERHQSNLSPSREETNNADSPKAMESEKQESSNRPRDVSTSIHNPTVSVELLNSNEIPSDDIIAPSQEERTLTGETLRTPNNIRKRKLYSSAGF